MSCSESTALISNKRAYYGADQSRSTLDSQLSRGSLGYVLSYKRANIKT